MISTYEDLAKELKTDVAIGTLIYRKIKYLNPPSGGISSIRLPKAATPVHVAKVKQLTGGVYPIKKVLASHINASTKKHDLPPAKPIAKSAPTTKTKEAKPAAETPTASKAATAEDLIKDLKKAAATFNVKFSDVILKKIQFLNPLGVKGNVVKVPLALDAKQTLVVKALASPKAVLKVNAAAQMKKSVPRTSPQYIGNAVDGPGIQIEKKLAYRRVTPPPDSAKVAEHKAAMLPAEKKLLSKWKGSSKAIRKKWVTGKGSTTFLSMLKKAPVVTGTVYRGIKVHKDPGDYGLRQIQAICMVGVGGTWTDPSPHSTSRDPSKAISFASGGILLRIKTKSARSIEHSGGGFESEQEAVGMPGTKYKILGITKHASVDAEGAYGASKGNKLMLTVDLEEA